MKRILSSFSSAIALTIDSPKRSGRTEMLGPTEIPRGGLTRTGPEGTTTAQAIIQDVMVYLITGAIILSLLFLLWGGIGWIMSGGEKSKIEAARKKIIYSVAGLLLVFFSFVIIITVGRLFRVDILNVF